MKKVSIISILFVGLSFVTQAQIVTIGTQVCMFKNLDVITFKNGDTIPEAKTNEEWEREGENNQPAWCYYENDLANGAKYGKVYNWYAVMDSRGLAPVGYRFPFEEEWIILTDYLGGEEKAGAKMKPKNGWYDDGNDTNRSNFQGVPVGFRNYDGKFEFIGKGGYWWSSKEFNTGSAFYRFLLCKDVYIYRLSSDKARGFYVRCLKG